MEARRTVIPMSDDGGAIDARSLSPTVLPDAFLRSDTASAALIFRLPRYDELPDLPLYREQVLAFIEHALAPLAGMVDGPWLTPSMVNNYVKAGLVAPPVKKLYGREQVARLLVICIFKQFLPIAAVQKLFRIQKVSYPTPVSYDYVADQVNQAMHEAFSSSGRLPADTATRVTRESLLVRSAATAFAAKAFLMAYLNYAGY